MGPSYELFNSLYRISTLEHSKAFHSLSLCMLVLENLSPLCLSLAMIPLFGDKRGGHQEEQLFAQIIIQLYQKLKAKDIDSNVYIGLSIFFDFVNVGFLASLLHLIKLYIKDSCQNWNSIEFEQHLVKLLIRSVKFNKDKVIFKKKCV